MSNNKNKNAVQTPASPEVHNNGDQVAVPNMLEQALTVPADVQSYLDSKAREIAIIRASAVIRLGGVLVEVKARLKDCGHAWLPFLRRPEVQLSEDRAQNAMKLYREFGNVNADLIEGVQYSKLLALSSLHDAEVVTMLLAEPAIKSKIVEATRDEVQAMTLTLKEEKEQLKGSVAAIREKLEAESKKYKDELAQLRNQEKGQIKIRETEIEHLKAQLAAASGLKNKADIDAVKQLQELIDAKDAELKALATQYDKVQAQNVQLKTANENTVTDKRLRAEIEELEAELKDKDRKNCEAIRELEAQLNEARERIADGRLAALKSSVSVPSFDFTESDLVEFLNSKGLFGEFETWFADKQATEAAKNEASAN